MAGAQCHRGDRPLGSFIGVVDFFNSIRIPNHGFFCVRGQGVFVGGTVLGAGDTDPFTVELVQRSANGADVVINTTDIDPSQTPVFNIVFGANSEDVNGTRCFVRLIGSGNETIIQPIIINAIP